MIEEQYFKFSTELRDEDFWISFAAQGQLAIDYKTMVELADCFVGFAEAPTGVFDHEMFEIETHKFDDLREMSNKIQEEHAAGKKMILYLIGSNYIRFVYV